jgi:hypothetical protein
MPSESLLKMLWWGPVRDPRTLSTRVCRSCWQGPGSRQFTDPWNNYFFFMLPFHVENRVINQLSVRC